MRMPALRALALLLALLGTARADRFADARHALGHTVKCPAPSPWCLAAAWPDSEVAELPRGTTLVGLTIEIPGERPADASFSVLAIDAEGDATLTDEHHPDAIPRLAALFAGKAKLVVLPDAAAATARGIVGADLVRTSAHGWTWTDVGGNRYELRRLGGWWIVMMDVSPAVRSGGRRWLVSVLTDAWR